MTDVNKKRSCEKKTFLQLIAQGRFLEVEKALINQPQLRNLLLHLPGLRHTHFFKKRIRFYKNFAKHNGMVSNLREQDKDRMRDAFAQSHCAKVAIKNAASKLLEEYENTSWVYRARKARLFCKRRLRF